MGDDFGVRKKLKTFYILKILSEETDENVGITTPEIIRKLDTYGISAERKSVYSDIDDLCAFGYDIVSSGGKNNEYRLVSREFELPELKLLVDSIKSAKFISEKKSQELIEKLKSFTSKNNGKKLYRQMYKSGSNKTDNENVLNTVDIINEAINEDKRIVFKYWNWNLKKEKEFKYKGEAYEVSPIALIWDNEYYYMAAYSHKYSDIRNYRVDKMAKTIITDEVRAEEARKHKIDVSKYSSKVFGMFDGELDRVELLCNNDMIGVIIDRLGKDIPIIVEDDEHFRTVIDVVVSEQFFGWIIGLGDKVKVIGPTPVLEQMQDRVRRLYKDYLV